MSRRLHSITALAAASATALTLGLAQAPGAGAAPEAPATASSQLLGETPAGLDDLDVRGTVAPTAAQLGRASALGSSVKVRWNSLGTPASIAPTSGSLGTAAGAPVTAARSWLKSNATLLGISGSDVDALEVVSDQPFADSPARAVLFRQKFGSLAPAVGGLVTVGIGSGKVQFVSSSLSRASGAAPAATLTAPAAWLLAAKNVGRDVSAGKISDVVSKSGWTSFDVAGLPQQQMARLRALPLADGSVRPVFEANVIDVQGGSASAYTLMVDAVTGKVLVRQNKVDQSSDAFQFQGTVTATACGPKHQFQVKDDKTRQIVATAATVVTTNDIEVKLFSPSGALLTTGDTGTSPEVATYTAASIPAGVYSMQVCPYDAPTAPFVGPGNYAAGVVTSDAATPSGTNLGSPTWRYFTSNPKLDWSPSTNADNSVIGCWTATTGCSSPTGPFENVAAPGAWDFIAKAGVPSFTTVGNNASTHEAWLNPLAPGGLAQAPVSPTRAYTTAFKDEWNNSKCNPANLVPGGNDINAATGNLFVAHNRMHDYAYYLGFTEKNYNLQVDNLGRNEDPTRANDPEIGNVQAGAITGGNPTALGRDNANQIALQDGVPGITNQYLFQPLAGAFYSPCTDGSLDMSIVGHEYTHAISNRMIGGPDDGITSEQGGAMGESWGDLTAAEYMFSHGYSNGTSPWVVGPYATGNKQAGIRDFPIDANPLNYSDYGFDSTGDEVHADGEIWNGTMWSVRQALVEKYNATYPYADKALQLRCAQAKADETPLTSSKCPGNRRWQQLIFDAFLLQQGATSMLDARDAMLAADRMRYAGADQAALWGAFAKRGMGSNASTPTADSGDTQAGLRLAALHAGQGDLHLAREGQGLHRQLRGPGHPGRRHRPRVGARQHGLARPGHLSPSCSSPPAPARFARRVTVAAGKTTSHAFAKQVNLASAAAGAKVLVVQRRQPQRRLADRRHRGDQLGRRQRVRLGRRHQPVRRGRPRGRRSGHGPPGPGVLDAATRSGQRHRPAAAPQPRGRPRLRRPVHRAAQVRDRDLRDLVLVGDRARGSASTPARPTPSRARPRARSRRT